MEPSGEEGRDKLRKAACRGLYPKMRGCPNGVTRMARCHARGRQWIAAAGHTLGSEPSEYQQEKKSNEIPPVAASERGGAQTGALRGGGVVGPRRGQPRAVIKRARSKTVLGRPAGEGESPVCETSAPAWPRNLSTAGHEESCRKLGGPPSKAKYSTATDSAQYREGKVKRTPGGE